MTDRVEIVSKAEFARVCNVTPGRVSQWIAEGKILPAHLVGTGRRARIKLAEARQQLRGDLDTTKARNEATGGTMLAQSTPSPAIPSDMPPDPAAYRERADLPDDPFVRGMLYGAHAVAADIPCLVASALKEAGASDEAALTAYREQASEYAGLLVSAPLLALGLITDEPKGSHPYAPTQFAGFDPSGAW